MRRPLLVPPLALLASACAIRPWTPSDGAPDWAEPPRVDDVDLPSSAEALQRWLLPPGNPWAPYAKYTLLSALGEAPRHVQLPDVQGLDEVRRARAAGARVARSGLPPDTLWILDMRGAQSVAFGVGLSGGGSAVSLVPTFNNWPAEQGFVPAEETLAALVAMAPMQTPDGAQAGSPVFLLDAWRMAYRDEEPADETYDNRYFLSEGDFPDVETLRVRGIRRVMYVVDGLGQTGVEEDDLHPLFMTWQLAGIRIAIADLDAFLEPVAHDRWDDFWVDRLLYILPRVTLFETPGFYARARGGFGGVRARPSVVASHGAWGFGAHGGGG